MKLNFLGAGYDEAWVPLGYFRRNFYNHTSFNSYAFDRATFFNDDPDAIQEQAATASAPILGKKGKPKSLAAKLFRHSHKKCCLPGGIGQPNFSTPQPKN
jgi:hypothetical protein